LIRKSVDANTGVVEIRFASASLYSYSIASKDFVAAFHDTGDLVADPSLVPGHQACQTIQTTRCCSGTCPW
jgi:hypothetical protein